MDTRDVIARFEAERQALALMDHPNIARVLDAGTTDSHRPYFVMELVRGVPITDYCDQAQLTPRERLGLFVQVCQAVQHAHQKGIIHRDLKPSNILVTQHDGTPVPKVIDFGVAKAVGQQLTDKTIYTRFTQMIGTPLYMSPEQAEMSGLDIDTRSDIFALGVLLYELLTGTTPFDGERLRQAAFDEVRRIIREEEPPRPSTRLSTLATLAAVSARRKTEPAKLSALVRGDLDWIVMKALDKDRTRRYETAHGLAQDVQRYLHDEPVQAGPPSAAYRLRKFVRRNRGPVLAAAGVLLVLLLGIAGTGWGLIEARHQRDAEEAARRLAIEERNAKDDALTQVEGERNAKADALTRMEQERNAKDVALTEVKAERDAKKTLLLRAEGLRLTAQSELVRTANPGLALLLAVEGAKRSSGVLSDGALRSALDACREEHTLARQGPVYCAAFSPDGRRVLTCYDDRTARVWDVGTGREIGRLQGHEGPVLFGAFSPDGRRLVTVSTKRRYGMARLLDGLKHVRTHDAATLKPLAHWSEPDDRTTQLDRICAVSFSPDGQRVACTFGRYPDWTPRVYETDTGKELLTLNGHDSLVTGMAFSPDGKRIVTTSLDHGTRIWDAADGKLLRRLDEKEVQPGLIVFSPDSRRVLTISEGWPSEIARDGNRIYRKFADDVPPWHGKAVELTAGRIWEVESGKELAELRWPKGSGALIRTADFSRDGKWVVMAGNGDTRDNNNSASGSGAGTYPCLWDATDGKFVTSLKPADLIQDGTRAVAFSPTARARGFLPW